MRVNIINIAKKYNLTLDCVVHVGAHFGQETEYYFKFGAKRVVLIEPCARAYDQLRKRFQDDKRILILKFACGAPDDPQEMIMHTGDYSVNSGMSNSLLQPKKHLAIHPDIEFTDEEKVEVRTLDKLVWMANCKPDLLVLDCQGYEGKVLQGATETLKSVKYILTEVNKDEVYENCTLVDELDNYLKDFQRVETGKWVRDSWTDAFYKR